MWAAIGANTDDTVQGGIPFGVREELVSKEQEVLLTTLFDLIKSQDVVNQDKDFIEVNRFSPEQPTVTDAATVRIRTSPNSWRTAWRTR